MTSHASPKVSIILPVYNGADFLDETFQSLVNQTFTDFELIVVDDGSTDQSVNRTEKWAKRDLRIKLVHNQALHGLPYALNRALQETRGTYIARSDQDDRHRPQRLAQEVEFLDAHPQIMLVGTGYQPFTATGSQPPIFHPTDAAMIAWKMLTASAFCHPSVMFRREVYALLGGYPVTGSEDFAYFSSIVRRWPAANLPIVSIDYRQHAANYSIAKKESMAMSVISTYRANMEHYVGNLDQAGVFYDWLVRRYLPLGRLRTISQACRMIISRIQQTYHLPSFDPTLRRLRRHVIKEIIVVMLRTFLQQPPIGQELKP